MPAFSIQVALLALPQVHHDALAARLDHFAFVLKEKHQLGMRDDSRLVWALVTESLPDGWDADRVMD